MYVCMYGMVWYCIVCMYVCACVCTHYRVQTSLLFITSHCPKCIDVYLSCARFLTSFGFSYSSRVFASQLGENITYNNSDGEYFSSHLLCVLQFHPPIGYPTFKVHVMLMANMPSCMLQVLWRRLLTCSSLLNMFLLLVEVGSHFIWYCVAM